MIEGQDDSFSRDMAVHLERALEKKGLGVSGDGRFGLTLAGAERALALLDNFGDEDSLLIMMFCWNVYRMSHTKKEGGILDE